METVNQKKLTFGQGDWDTDRRDIIELCGTWWEDSLFYKLYGVKYKVDVEMFKNIFRADALIYTCGRNEDGKLIACYVGLKATYMFNVDFIFASEVVWCVHKEHRNFRNIVSLLDAMDTLMREKDIYLWNINVSNEEQYNTAGKYLEKRGYKFLDKCYSMYKGECYG